MEIAAINKITDSERLMNKP